MRKKIWKNGRPPVGLIHSISLWWNLTLLVLFAEVRYIVGESCWPPIFQSKYGPASELSAQAVSPWLLWWIGTRSKKLHEAEFCANGVSSTIHELKWISPSTKTVWNRSLVLNSSVLYEYQTIRKYIYLWRGPNLIIKAKRNLPLVLLLKWVSVELNFILSWS